MHKKPAKIRTKLPAKKHAKIHSKLPAKKHAKKPAKLSATLALLALASFGEMTIVSIEASVFAANFTSANVSLGSITLAKFVGKKVGRIWLGLRHSTYIAFLGLQDINSIISICVASPKAGKSY